MSGRRAPWLHRLTTALVLGACGGQLTDDGGPGRSDAGHTDAGVSGAVTCTELASGVDPWRDLLGARGLTDRGALIGCVHVTSVRRDDVAASPFFRADLGPAENGYEIYVLEYVSETRPGVADAVTALAYLPSGGMRDVPLVAVDHATTGMAHTCGPSHLPPVTDPLAVPLVSHGYAVIAPDYAGMGVEGETSSYLVGDAEAAATIDALRAVRQLHDTRFDASTLVADAFVIGHSQGGHAALFTEQAVAQSAEVRLAGVVAIAPGLGSARAWSTFFVDPTRPVGPMETFAAMSLYANERWAGGPDTTAWMTPAAATTLPALFADECLPDLLASVSRRFATIGDLYAPSFLAAAAGCSFAAPCQGFEPWSSTFIADEPGSFASSVPTLVVEGLADVVAPPWTVACVVERLNAHGTPVRACAYASDDHTSVVASSLGDVLRWMEARRRGETLDVCPAPLGIRCPAP